MSKEVVIAGTIVAACLGLVVVAFVIPKQKAVVTEVVKQVELAPTPPSNDDLMASKPSDDFLLPGNNSQFPPSGPTDQFTNPNRNHQPTPYPAPGTSSNQPGNSFNQSGSFPRSSSVPFPPMNPPTGVIDPPLTKLATSEAKTHVVTTGETLGEISQKYYGTGKNWKKIADANKVDPSELKVGQKLTIPAIETASTTVTPAPELANGERNYTVQKNDSYYSIAKKELGNAARWKELEKLNNVPADELRVGKVIKLPAKAAAVEALKPGPEALSAGDANVHVVKGGETLSDISKLHYGTTTKWKEIVKANPGIDPEGLKVGQKIKLPEIAGAPKVPESGALPSTGTSKPTESSANPAATYTVKAGDTPASIAKSQIGPKADGKKIIEANPGLDPNKMRIGQKLVIPGKSAPAEPLPPVFPSNKPTVKPPFGGIQPAPGGAQRPTGGNFPIPPASGGNRFEAPLNATGGTAYPQPTGLPPAAPGSNFPTPSTNNDSFGLPSSTPSPSAGGTRTVP